MKTAALQKADTKNQSVSSLFKKNEDTSPAETNEASWKNAPAPAFNFGNLKVLHSGSALIQPKLQINQPGDQYEQEADAMADKVMRMPDPLTSRQSSQSNNPPLSFGESKGKVIQLKCAECEKEDEEKKVQRKENNTSYLSATPPIIQDVLNSSSGKKMDDSTRSFMESRFNYDFGNVKIHNNELAAKSTDSIHAWAYTSGNNVVFNTGRYSPNTQSGKRLLAHELAHVVQQSNLKPLRNGQQRSNIPIIQREEKTELTEADLSWLEKGAIEVGAAPARAFGDTAYRMVKATFRGFVLEVKIQMKAKGSQFWEKVKSALSSPTELGAFILHYWWGLVKGIFSPITGLFDLAKLAVTLSGLPAHILSTAWTKRDKLAADAGKIAENFAGVAKKGKDAIGGFLSSPIQTVKAIMPWIDTVTNKAEAAAESGGRKAGDLLMAQLDKPLPELGEVAGEVVGTVLVNVVLFIFTEGIGNAITQIASKLGELGAFLGKFGQAAQMFGKLAAEIGDLLGTIGGWITKAEGLMAKAAETILKPLSPLLEELGGLVGGLRSFLRELLGVSEEAGVAASEQIGAGAGRAAEPHVTSPKSPQVHKEVSAPVSKPSAKPAPLADNGSELAGKTVAKDPPIAKPANLEEPPIKKPDTDASLAVKEKPKVVPGEPGQRRVSVGEGHEVVEVPDNSISSGIRCELHSPPPFPTVPCPPGLGGPSSKGPVPPKRKPFADDPDFHEDVKEMEDVPGVAKPENTEDPLHTDPLEPKTRKQAGVSLEETHHIATKYRAANKAALEKAGLSIDDDLNLIKDFPEHGQLRGSYDWKNGKYEYNMRGHHKDYNNWVTDALKRATPKGITPELALDRVTKIMGQLDPIIRTYPEVLSHGPDILPAGLKILTF